MLSAQFQLDIGAELIIDNFAGGGGASSGIERAIGRPVDIAINHAPEAVAMHAANHPQTLHLCESVWDGAEPFGRWGTVCAPCAKHLHALDARSPTSTAQ